MGENFNSLCPISICNCDFWMPITFWTRRSYSSQSIFFSKSAEFLKVDFVCYSLFIYLFADVWIDARWLKWCRNVCSVDMPILFGVDINWTKRLIEIEFSLIGQSFDLRTIHDQYCHLIEFFVWFEAVCIVNVKQLPDFCHVFLRFFIDCLLTYSTWRARWKKMLTHNS